LSEYITHTAVFEDCARLALHSPGICAPFKTVLKRYWDIASLGTLTRSGDKYTVELLSWCRDRWANRRDGDFLEEKLAYVLGWRCHNAADRHFKPIYREVEPEHYKNEAGQRDPDERDVSDVRIYHDIIVFREVYDCGRRKNSPVSPHLLEDNLGGHPAAAAVAVAPTETAIGGVIQRTLLGLQAFTTHETDSNRWLARFQKQLQDYYVDIHRYARAEEQADPDFLRRFILENRFYDRRDPLIRLARALQSGAARPDVALEPALEQAQKQSQYAQTIRQGYLYLEASSLFFERKIDETELRKRLDLGTAHYKPLTGGTE
jgi:hypothetical protein